MKSDFEWITLQEALTASTKCEDIQISLNEILFNVSLREKRELEEVELEFNKRKQDIRDNFKVSDVEKEAIISLVKENMKNEDDRTLQDLSNFKYYLQGRNDLNSGFKLACIQLFYKMM